MPRNALTVATHHRIPTAFPLHSHSIPTAFRAAVSDTYIGSTSLHTLGVRELSHTLPWSRLFKRSYALLAQFNTHTHTERTHKPHTSNTRAHLYRHRTGVHVHVTGLHSVAHVRACVCMSHKQLHTRTHAIQLGGSVIHDIPCSADTPTIYGFKPCGSSAPYNSRSCWSEDQKRQISWASVGLWSSPGLVNPTWRS